MFRKHLRSELRLPKTGACLPDDWICDGFIQCPTAIDELNCPIRSKSSRIEIVRDSEIEIFIKAIYVAHENYPRTYKSDQLQVQTIRTSDEMIFVLYFERFHLEIDRTTGSCADYFQVQYEVAGQNVLNQYCGNIETGDAPFLPEKRMFVPSNKMEIQFTSDSFTQFGGFLIRIESIPKSVYMGFIPTIVDATSFNQTESFKCQDKSNLHVIIPRRLLCNNILDCPLGDDETGCNSVGQKLSEYFYWQNQRRTKITFPSGMWKSANLVNLEDSFIPRIRTQSDSIIGEKFQCPLTNRTIPALWTCDGFLDCKFGDDELQENCKNQHEILNLFNYNDVNTLCDSVGLELTLENDRSALLSHPNYPSHYAKFQCNYRIKARFLEYLQIL